MWSIFTDLLASEAGSATFVAALMFFFFFFAYKIGVLTKTFGFHQEDIKDLKQRQSKIAEMEANHNVLKKQLDDQHGKIDKISESILLMRASLSTLIKSDPLTQSNSPLGLSPMGREIIESNGIEKMINENWTRINEYSASIVNENPYDIQQFFIDECTLRLQDLIGEKYEDKVKSISFNLGIPFASISRAIAVVIRDRFFLEHKINISDVDKHDPNNPSE